MARVIWTEEAERDLDDILAYYLEEAGVEVAQAVFTRMRDQIASLRLFPHRSRPGRVTGTREYVLHRLPYIAVVSVVDDTVAVLALVHTARQYP
jgi:toxin ParE1/3/4